MLHRDIWWTIGLRCESILLLSRICGVSRRVTNTRAFVAEWAERNPRAARIEVLRLFMLTHDVSPYTQRICTRMTQPYADPQMAAALMEIFNVGNTAMHIDPSLVPLVIVNRRIMLRSFEKLHYYAVRLYSRDGVSVIAWGYYSCGGFRVRDGESGALVEMRHRQTYNTTKMRLSRAYRYVFG